MVSLIDARLCPSVQYSLRGRAVRCALCYLRSHGPSSSASELLLQIPAQLRATEDMAEEEVLRSAGATGKVRPASSSASVFDIAPAWLTVAQLSHRWQLDRKTIYKFIDAGSLPAWKVGARLYRVAVADLLVFEAQNRLATK